MGLTPGQAQAGGCSHHLARSTYPPVWDWLAGHLSLSPFPTICPLQECGLLRKGTVLLADNVICPGTPEFLAYVRGNSRFECTHFTSYLEYAKTVDGLEKAVYLGPGSPTQP